MNWHLISSVLESPVVRVIYLWGPPGVGKTYSAYKYGKDRLSNGVYSITLTEDTPAAELRGHYIPEGSTMRWHDGPLIKAMREGARLVLNEISHASPEALSFMHPILEGKDTAQVTLPTGETVRPTDGFHVIATDNMPPRELPFALKDRFEAQFVITSPHPDALEKLPKGWRKHCQVSCGLEDSDRRVSLRGWFAIRNLVDSGMQLSDACKIVLGEKQGQLLNDSIALS